MSKGHINSARLATSLYRQAQTHDDKAGVWTCSGAKGAKYPDSINIHHTALLPSAMLCESAISKKLPYQRDVKPNEYNSSRIAILSRVRPALTSGMSVYRIASKSLFRAWFPPPAWTAS